MIERTIMNNNIKITKKIKRKEKQQKNISFSFTKYMNEIFYVFIINYNYYI